MFCPACGTQNPDASRFCKKCGTQLPAIAPKAATSRPDGPAVLSSTTIGGAIVVSGSLTVIGWLLPWFRISGNFGGILDGLLGLGGFGNTGLPLGFSVGLGNGLQLTLLLIGSAIAAFVDAVQDSSSRLIAIVAGLIILVAVAIVVSVVVLGILNIRAGLRLIESPKVAPGEQRATILNVLHQTRRRSVTGMILLVVIFGVVSLVPFFPLLSGSGFVLIVISFVLAFVSTLVAKSSLSTR